ncbi:MAG: hypothetical protein AAFP02_02540, partial [Bacteroidota bacterium]
NFCVRHSLFIHISMFQVNPFEYENLVRELYYRDLRQLDGPDREQEDLQNLLTDYYAQNRWKTFLRQSKALWRLIFR